MTGNGANGDTLSQMEGVLGLPIEELNNYIYSYMRQLWDEKYADLHLANSIWIKDDEMLSVKEDFLKKNATYYDAQIYKIPFNNSALNNINSWVNEHTDGMIPEILEEIPEDAIMYLVNALAFEAEWADTYRESQVDNALFTLEDGSTTDVEMMYNEESTYLEDEYAAGFIKYYKGGNYAFAALLPKEGIRVEEYVATLTGERLQAVLSNSTRTPVRTAIPKFESEYDVEMSEILKNMGMIDAFDKKNADFSNLGTFDVYNIYINNVIHKTHITVAEQGTKAGAATGPGNAGADRGERCGEGACAQSPPCHRAGRCAAFAG